MWLRLLLAAMFLVTVTVGLTGCKKEEPTPAQQVQEMQDEAEDTAEQVQDEAEDMAEDAEDTAQDMVKEAQE